MAAASNLKLFSVVVVLCVLAVGTRAMAENQQIISEPSEKQSGESTNHHSSIPRTYWPELVGKTPEEAMKKIKEEMPWVYFQIAPVNSFVTLDYVESRVRLFLDPSGKVGRPPMIG